MHIGQMRQDSLTHFLRLLIEEAKIHRPVMEVVPAHAQWERESEVQILPVGRIFPVHMEYPVRISHHNLIVGS